MLHEDRDIVVVDKAPGLLTVATDRNTVDTAYFRLTDYVQKGNPKSRERVHVVHRLDREVSGILLFARTVEAKQNLQLQWDKVEKHYLALVHGAPPEERGTITSYLAESGVHRVRSSQSAARGKRSSTKFEVVRRGDGFSLLDVSLVTGRKHQIRIHLAEHGLPIFGDKKYGVRRDRVRRLGLHAKSLSFDHPYRGDRCFFETRVPRFFTRNPLEA